MTFTLLFSVCSLATKLTATIPTSPSSSSSPSLLSPTHAVKEDLERLQRTLRRIQAVLADAERREILDESVKLWVKELKGVAYEAEDVLEEYEHELRRIQVESRVASAEGTRKRKREQEEQEVRDLNSILSHLSIPERIRNIGERFDEISKDREALHLREGDGIRRADVSMNWPQPTSSHVDESGIFGREQDKDEVIEMLFSDESCRFSVIPIVGMGGLGKTTLAQLVYNDKRVQQYFDCTCWVCVSENFDVSRLTKEMIESISKESCDLRHLNALQDILKKQVEGKKVLLVLDDVWNEQQGPWDSFRAPLGSVETIRIIVTTRNDPVAEIMQTVSPYHPACLSNDQCWLLFRHRAFSGRDPKDYSHLEEIGRKIIEKCGRLPLSVKTIGGLLHYEFDEDRWTDILGSDLWNLDQAKMDILPALLLSYHHLPAHLKSCFLFSSLFPKDYEFKKNRLVKLWITQGFILPCGNQRLEDIGSQYFDELRMRSLFQSAYSYHQSADNGYFVLHDAIHDVARSISDNEYLSITVESDEVRHDIPKEVRHLFVQCNSSMTVDRLKFYDPRILRTLIVEEDFWFKQTSIVNLDSLGCLRAVELRGPKECLTSVSNLKHLRHLYIKNGSNDCDLPESPCHLYNLLYLNIEFNKEVFINIGNLVSLRHLSLCGLAVFPGVISVENNELGLRKRPCHPPSSNLWKYVESDGILPCLSKFTIKENSKLTRLPLLWSSLQSLRVHDCINLTSLSCLQNLTSLRKLHLSLCLKLQFRQEESLPSKLQDVCISDCWKLRLVTGLKNLTSLKSLVLERCPLLQISPDECLPCTPGHVKIRDCLRLREWCRRHQFQCIQDISIKEELNISSTSEITDIYGVDNLSSLKRLYLNPFHESYLTLAEWLPPTVQTLVIHSSKNLKCLSLYQNVSLRQLKIQNCSELTSVVGMQNNSLKELVITNCPILQLFSPNEYLPSSLQSLEVNGCKSLTSLPLHLNLSSLENLIINDCLKLTSVVGMQTLNFLKELTITNCPEIQFVPNDRLPSSLHSVRFDNCMIEISPLHQNPSLYRQLIVENCLDLSSVFTLLNFNSMEELVIKDSIPLQIEYLPSKLHSLEVNGCESLSSLPLHQNLSLLKKLIINECLNLISVVGFQNLNSLKELVIKDCPELQLSPNEYLPSSLNSLEVNGCKSLRSLPLHQNLSSLVKLNINDCLNLMSVVGIQNLNSLKELVIKDCPAVQLSPNEYLPCSLHSLNVSECKSLRSLPLLHHKMSAFEMLKLSNCSSLTDVCGLSDVPSLRYGIIWDCPEVLLSSEEWLRINCPLQLELATSGLRPQQSDTMAPAKKIDAEVGNKDQFLQLGRPIDHASNSLRELPSLTDINAEPQQT